MKRSLKLTIGITIPIAVLLVLLYFFLWPITITVSAIFPTDAQGNPTIKAISSIEEVTLSKDKPSAKLKAKRKDSVDFVTLEGVLLDRKEIVREVKELKYAFPEPDINLFNYSFSEDGKELILSWRAESSPYNIDSVSLERNGTAVTRKGDSYTDNIVDYQGKRLSYDLTIGYKYGPVYIEKSKTLSVEIPMLPVEIEVKVSLGKGLDPEKVSLLLDEKPYKLESNLKAIISTVPQGKHKLELKYDGISLLTKEVVLKWNDDIPYLFEFPIDSIEISELSATRDGENMNLNWKSDLKSYEETDVSYLITVDASNFVTKEKSFVLTLPEETMQIVVTPLYKGVAFGLEETVEVLGKPFFELGTIPGYIPSTSLEIQFEAKNISELLLSLDGAEPAKIDTQKGKIVFEELSEGVHAISFYITDLYGESFTKSATFVVDTTPPNEPTLLNYNIVGKRIIINLATSSDTVSISGEVNVSDTTTFHIETKNNQITVPVPSPETGFNGTLELFLTAIDRAGNMSMQAHYEIELVNFEEIVGSLGFDVIQKDYKPVTLRISNSRVSEEASITVFVETLKGTRLFTYNLSNTFSVSEPLEGVYFGDLKISYIINALGIESPTYVATETRVDLKNLDGFYAYQVDEDGKFRVRFYPVPDPDVKYRIRRKILDTPVNQEIKTISFEETDLDSDTPILKDFDSPLPLTNNATMEISVEVEIITDQYSYKFPEKRLTLYKGATILTGNATDAEFDKRAFPILIAENYTIPNDSEVSIAGKGLVLIQDGSSFVVNGTLNISGSNGLITLKSESRNEILLYGGELNLKKASGYEMSIFASGARLNIEDCVFSDVFNPLIVKNGSSVKLNNISINSVGTAGYISDAVIFDAHDVEIINSTKGFILINPQKAYINKYVANTGIKNTGLEIKNSLSDEIVIEDLDISSGRFALNIENLKSMMINNARLKASGFYVMALSNVEKAQVADVSISGIPGKAQPNIGLFVASTGGIFKGISVSQCKEIGIFINNRWLPEELIETYNALPPKEKENWAPIELYTKTEAFSENFYDIYLEGIYNLRAPGLDLSRLRIYDWRVDKTWSNELGKIFPRGTVIVK
ncbi:hypothetical protein AT15_07535 [Kosmotoga arenicorallina S304]|uniref:Right handed beta helix domain-containing protein n=1 Tax=Kosmotoga arenicorallina S304 TaxID=1453497 RepID=A0A182C789_9BACT|nr:hypothetical protein [Kosmotoga arenicorallina]OAA31340.1 hypothetical protein AT15_07535 [Kosmotoga arenicorallina S304]